MSDLVYNSKMYIFLKLFFCSAKIEIQVNENRKYIFWKKSIVVMLQTIFTGEEGQFNNLLVIVLMSVVYYGHNLLFNYLFKEVHSKLLD